MDLGMKQKLLLLLFLSLLLFRHMAQAACPGGVCTAASLSQADVTTATNTAIAGDTVMLPAGTATWTDPFSLNKFITIKGAGTTSGASLTKIILTKPFQVGFTGNIRLTQIYFDCVDKSVAHQFVINFTGPSTQTRVDHCVIKAGQRSLTFGYTANASGNCYGVVDHNEFIETDISIAAGNYRIGDTAHGDVAWSEPLRPGTVEALVVETNTFTHTTRSVDEDIYCDRGAKVTIRHNAFNYSVDPGLALDAHGAYGGLRGTIMYEVYENVFTGPTYKMCHLRGGTHFVFNNTFTGAIGTCVELDGDLGDYINNTYVWGNTRNGTPVSYGIGTGYVGNGGPHLGAVSAHEPFNGQPFYPYTPLVYPHPLVTGTPTGPILSVTPGFQDFGYVDVDGSSSLTWVVRNTGSGTLTGTASVPAPFVVTGGASYNNLATNQTQTVIVAYRPTVAEVLDQQNLVFTGGGGATYQVTGRTPLADLNWDSTVGIIAPPFVIDTATATIAQTVDTADPNVGGRALYRFIVVTPGDYSISALVNWPDGGSNSFFANVDTEPTTSNIWTGAVTAGLQSRPITWGASTTAHVFSLSAGKHDLIIRGREPNAKLGHITAAIVTPAENPAITVTPTSLDFPLIINGNTLTKSVRVKNTGTGTLNGTATVGAGRFDITGGGTYSLGAGLEQTVFVRYSPNTYGASNTGTITFTGGGGATVALAGTSPAAPPEDPVISVSPLSIDYGTVLVGAFSNHALVVSNTGDGTLTGEAAIDPPFYILNVATFSLTHGQSKILLTRYQPETPGATSNGTIAVTSNDANVNVPVTGIAAETPSFAPPIGLIISPTGTQTISVGDSVTFSGTGIDPAGGTLDYLWTFGIGSGVSNSTDQNPGSTTFDNPGTFTVTLTVTNDDEVSDPHPPTRTIIVSSPTNTGTTPAFIYVVPNE